MASDIRVPVEMIPSGIFVTPDKTPSAASVKKPSYRGSLLVGAEVKALILLSASKLLYSTSDKDAEELKNSMKKKITVP